MLLVEGTAAKKLVVLRHCPVLPADGRHRGAEILVIGTASEAALPIVNNSSAIAVHESAILIFVAQATELGPAVDPILCQPNMLVIETAGRHRVTKPDDAFP